MKWVVEIVEDATGKVEKRLEYASERAAAKAERGVHANLDHNNYFTRVRLETGEPPEDEE